MHASMKELYKHLERNIEPKHLICPNCGKDIFTRKKQVKFCCDACKTEYQHKLAKKVYKCVVCGKDFTDANGKYRYCSEECQRKAKNAALRDVYNNGGKEKQREYRRKNRDKINATHREYVKRNYDRVMELTYRSHRASYDMRRRERIASNQEALFFDADLGLMQDKYKSAFNKKYECLHIHRLTRSSFVCLDCGEEFVLTKNPSGIQHILDDRIKAGNKNPCPYCGDAPVGMHRVVTVEVELQKMYPSFTELNIRPDWMGGQELDLYDPVARIAIEFNGIRWHSSKHRKNASYHMKKADMAEAAGIHLIQINEDEWVQKRECVIDKLDAIMHKNMERIAARKCELQVMETPSDKRIVKEFMDENHIQGPSSNQWAVSLIYKGEIIAVCTFKYGTGYAAGGHVENTRTYWELNRYATKLHTTVQGGLSRCIAAFKKAHPEVHEIISFADRRWTCRHRSAYAATGFKEVGTVPQNYMYTDLKPNHELKNKQYMRKSAIERRAIKDPDGPEAKVFDRSKTEFQMAEELGYYRIWDAGKIKYSMEL